ncbi:MAG: hypothetical protein Q8L14_02040 [Myxococcales bacterium]|nr:hypothetical protein [Myxococcales bacterium]
MSRFLFLAVILSGAAALAKPWQGIQPGVSSALDVFGKFGEPTRKTDLKGQTVLVYAGLQAVPGTVQAQFKLAPGTQTVVRIDVYPAPKIDKEAIEASYGPACNPKVKNPDAESPCYFVKELAGKKPYLLFLKLGLAVFFKDDGKQVQSFAFLPAKE